MTEDKLGVAPKKENGEGRDLAEIKRKPLVVEDVIPVLDTGRFEQMQRIANVMVKSSMIGQALKGSSPEQALANCFIVVNQAVRWNMDPFALSQHAFEIHKKIGYEGKVIAAAVNSDRALNGSLNYAYDGEGQGRRVVVSGTLAGEESPRTVEGTVAGWKTDNENWGKAPDQMLSYRGAREWARRHMPEVILGVYSDDELTDMRMRDMGALRPAENGTFVPAPERPPERGDYAEAWVLRDIFGTVESQYVSPHDWASMLVKAIEADPLLADEYRAMNADAIDRLRNAGLGHLVEIVEGAGAMPKGEAEPEAAEQVAREHPDDEAPAAPAEPEPSRMSESDLPPPGTFRAVSADGTVRNFPTIGEWQAYMDLTIRTDAGDPGRLDLLYANNEAVMNGIGQNPGLAPSVEVIRAVFRKARGERG